MMMTDVVYCVAFVHRFSVPIYPPKYLSQHLLFSSKKALDMFLNGKFCPNLDIYMCIADQY